MVTNNHTACGLAQEAATNQKASNSNGQLLKDWYRFYDIRRVYLTADEMATLHEIAKAKAGVA